jgi:hypothetical protein
MSKETAVEWLEDEIKNYWKSKSVMNHELFTGLLNIAKRMEKEQIIQSWHNGYNNQSPMIDEENCGNTYYKETYGGDHE